MEKYILNLLKENNRVIIPDFGAFIIRQQNPPEIAFNGLLTFNDGILTEYVSKEAGISYLEAAVKVSDYTEKLKTDLHQHNRLTFNEIGWIWTDDSGEMQFTPLKDAGKMASKSRSVLKDLNSILKEAEKAYQSPEESQPEEPINQGKIPEPKINSAEQVPFTLDETLKEVEVDATKDVLVQKSSDSDIDTQRLTEESFTLEESEKPVSAENTITDKFDEKIMASISAIKAKSAEKDPGRTKPLEELSPEDDWRLKEIKSTYSAKSKKEKKKRPWILPVTMIGLLIILAGSAWFVFPDQVKNILSSFRHPAEQNLTKESAGGTSDAALSENENSDQLYEQEQSKEPEQVQDQEPAPGLDEEVVSIQPETPAVTGNTQGSERKYYIVAGCFKSRVNAEQFVIRLQEKGFSAELFGTHDNLYAVSFSSFSTKVQAEEELKRIHRTTEPDAWILLY